jgi:XisH protein
MPRKDIYHDTVVKALKKGGWIIESEQALLIIENRQLWVDLRVSNAEIQRTILVEVKSFISASQVEDLANAVGKYVMYRAIIEDNELDEELYLAIPQSAYDGIFSEHLGQLLLRKLSIKLVVFDVNSERLIQWLS